MIKKNYGRIVIFQLFGLKIWIKFILEKTYDYSVSKYCFEFISKEIRNLESKNILTTNNLG